MSSGKDLVVLIDGHRVGLSLQQHMILMALWNARGSRLTNSQLINTLWHPDKTPESWAICLRTLIYKLRQQLLPTRFQISTSYNFGYQLKQKKEPAHGLPTPHPF